MNKTFKFFVDTTFRANSKLSGRVKLLLSAGLFGIGFALLFAQDFARKPFVVKSGINPRPTHSQLNEKRSDVQVDGKIEVAEAPIKLGKIRSGKSDSLIKRSAVLCQGGYWTIVPKEAVLHIPRHLTNRVNAGKKGKLVAWADFQNRNRGWLQLQEVSLEQARGEADIPEAIVKRYRTSARVVVAICHGGPISVKPRKAVDGDKLVKGDEDPLGDRDLGPILK